MVEESSCNKEKMKQNYQIHMSVQSRWVVEL